MKTILKTEELAQLVVAVIGFNYLTLEISWWLWIILFLSPDFGMLGYLINPKIGAFTYNLLHHKLVALAIGLLGFFVQNEVLLFTGILLFTHACFDRLMGYGLKYLDSFNHTHLGMVGNSNKK